MPAEPVPAMPAEAPAAAVLAAAPSAADEAPEAPQDASSDPPDAPPDAIAASGASAPPGMVVDGLAAVETPAAATAAPVAAEREEGEEPMLQAPAPAPVPAAMPMDEAEPLPVPDSPSGAPPPTADMSDAALRAQLRAVFEAFDADHSGEVNTAEMTAMVSSLGLHVTPAQLEAMLLEADTDGSGEIGLEEFERAVKTQLRGGAPAGGDGFSLGARPQLRPYPAAASSSATCARAR